jgi:serine/threonine protein phosphatase PrpC
MATAYRLNAATAIHKGDREYQQDQVALINHRSAHGCLLGVVADGMGGLSGGRKASNQVLLTARQLFERYDPHTDDATSLLTQLVREAHIVIKLVAVSSEEQPHSTIAAFLLNPGGDCHWVHTGDSRIYHFHGNTLVKRTLDHSLVQKMVSRGEITEDEANTHPKANILTGCAGSAEDPPMETHLITQIRPGDSLLACSDGVWHYFNDRELGSIMSTLPPRDASEFLITKARARARGHADNLSLIAMKFESLSP